MTTLTTRCVLSLGLLGVTACGGTTADRPNDLKADPPHQATTATTTDPCSVTNAAAIQAVTGGTVSQGVPGHARNCEYTIAGGSTAVINVFAFGTAAELAGIRAGYETNRDGTETLSGIGNSAFSPRDVGRNEVVVEADGTIFAVAVPAISAQSIDPTVERIAKAVATNLSAQP